MPDDRCDLWASTQDAQQALNTDPSKPKGYLGDAAAAYGMLSFKWKVGDDTPTLRLVGKLPKARYVSFQSYEGLLQSSWDTLTSDYIEPDADGLFRITLKRGKKPESRAAGHVNNYLALPGGGAFHHKPISVFYRIYVPDTPFTPDDLPVIEASGGCPDYFPMPVYLRFHEWFADVIVERNKVTFGLLSLGNGTNNDISQYCASASNIPQGDVVVIRFPAPRSPCFPYPPGILDQVQYWSICSVDWPHIKTLNGLPDYASQPPADAKNNVYLVFGGVADPGTTDGTSTLVKNKAHGNHYNYLPDTRDPKQHVLGFLYRNLEPLNGFQPFNDDAQIPQACVCSQDEFLNPDWSFDKCRGA